MKFPDDLFEKMRPQIEHAVAAMRELEAGAIANPTEKRMVGHYWLRSPVLAATGEIRSEIEETIWRIKTFAEDVHSGKISAEDRRRFKHLLHIGIGGSALGPNLCQLRWARQTIQWTSFSSTTPTWKVLTKCFKE